jgi:signal transduction histidine kinase
VRATQNTVSIAKHESLRADGPGGRAQRLAGLGTVAIGVAHKWRGLSVSSGTALARRLLSLSSVVRETLPAMRAVVANTAELRIAIDARAPLVEINPTAMQRVLMKLVLNASQAIRQPNGVIEIGVAAVIGSDGHSRPLVRLTVADNGIGMDGATVGNLRLQIAKPAELHGTGIGLRIVHRAVCAHGGRLQIDSHPGSGTTVRIDLPAASAQSWADNSDVCEGDDPHSEGCRPT